MTTERIEINPATMMGKPVIRGTRITVELILRKLAEGASGAELLEDYPHLTTGRHPGGKKLAVPRLRRWKKRKFSLLIPALTRWAKVCRASGAEQAGRSAGAETGDF